jgi:hypothetical protein
MKYTDEAAGVKKLPRTTSCRRPERTIADTEGGRGRHSAMEYNDKDAGLRDLPRETKALPCCRFER